uniref:Transmembrane protein n=1 Tax=Panagrolaimus sp. JU765 TaxID=591449 RepID=A0AC34R122_9BILA
MNIHLVLFFTGFFSIIVAQPSELFQIPKSCNNHIDPNTWTLCRVKTYLNCTEVHGDFQCALKYITSNQCARELCLSIQQDAINQNFDCDLNCDQYNHGFSVYRFSFLIMGFFYIIFNFSG